MVIGTKQLLILKSFAEVETPGESRGSSRLSGSTLGSLLPPGRAEGAGGVVSLRQGPRAKAADCYLPSRPVPCPPGRGLGSEAGHAGRSPQQQSGRWGPRPALPARPPPPHFLLAWQQRESPQALTQVSPDWLGPPPPALRLGPPPLGAAGCGREGAPAGVPRSPPCLEQSVWLRRRQSPQRQRPRLRSVQCLRESPKATATPRLRLY